MAAEALKKININTKMNTSTNTKGQIQADQVQVLWADLSEEAVVADVAKTMII